jgi:hypothetical protein
MDDNMVRHMKVLHGIGQELRAEHLKMGAHLEDSGLRVQMVDGGHFVTPSDNA